jgi:hypothetical protein
MEDRKVMIEDFRRLEDAILGLKQPSKVSLVRRVIIGLLAPVMVFSCSVALALIAAASVGVQQVNAQTALTIGVPTSDNFSTSGDANYYEVVVGAGQTLSIVLDGSSDASYNQNQVYVRYGDLPTTTVYDFVGVLSDSPDQAVLISNTLAGTYYILAYCSYYNGWGDPFGYTITVHSSNTFPTLTTGVTSDDQMETSGDSNWYQVVVGAGQTLSIVLDGSSDASYNQNQVYVRYGDLPTTTVYDFVGVLSDSPDQAVLISNTLAGTYYILAYCSYYNGWGDPFGYTITVDVNGGANSSPSQPSNVSPVNTATDISLTPALGGSAFSDPDAGDTHAASQWQITATSGSYTSPVFDSGVDTANKTQITVPSGKLIYNTTYYWHVKYQDSHGNWSDWSAETSFTTTSSTSSLNAPPNRPTNVFPSNGATDITSNPTIVSSAFSDPDSGDTHAASEWQVRFGTSDYYTYTDVSNLTSIPVPSGILSLSTTYYWRVRYQDNHGNWSDWSSETSFTTEDTASQPPIEPSNVSPINGATDVSLAATLRSSAFSDSDSGDTHAASQWQITTSAGDYSSTVFDGGRDVSNLTQLGVPSGVLNATTTYYWKVRHQDNHGNWSDYSAETSFTTGSDGNGGGDGSTTNDRSFFYVIGAACGGVVLIGASTGYLWRRRRAAALMAPYMQQLKQWEDGGYDVSDFKKKWFE